MLLPTLTRGQAVWMLEEQPYVVQHLLAPGGLESFVETDQAMEDDYRTLADTPQEQLWHDADDHRRAAHRRLDRHRGRPRDRCRVFHAGGSGAAAAAAATRGPRPGPGEPSAATTAAAPATTPAAATTGNPDVRSVRPGGAADREQLGDHRFSTRSRIRRGCWRCRRTSPAPSRWPRRTCGRGVTHRPTNPRTPTSPTPPRG